MKTVVTAFLTFAATNIDDIFILMLFFSQTNHSFRRRHIVIGQYLGFVALVLVSLLGFLGTFAIPKAWIGFLGLLPIMIGLHKLFGRSNPDVEPGATNALQPSPPNILSSFLNPRTYSVAAVTFANGGDNIGIYTPLFANSGVSRLITIIGVFLTLVAVWCFLGYQLTRQQKVAELLSRYGHILVPFILIGLGVYILVENETLKQFGLLR